MEDLEDVGRGDVVRVFFALLVAERDGSESGVSGDERFLEVGLVGEEVRLIGAERFLDGAAAAGFAVEDSRVGRAAFWRMNPGIVATNVFKSEVQDV